MDHIESLISRYDSSFFFYDLDSFEKHVQEIKKTLHPDVKVFYACKANPLSQILRILDQNDFGVDVASMGELKQAQNAKVKKLIATGPAKSKKYLEKLVTSGVSLIVIESLSQLRDLNELACEHGKSYDVLLRVQLDWSGSLKSVLGGSSITPFGLGVEDWKKISLSEYTHLNIKGLHCFQWGNILKLSQLQEIWDSTISQCVNLANDLGIDLEVLDLGGGLGISYQTDEELSFKEVHTLLLSYKEKYKLKEIWLELGRFCIGKFGSYFTKIIDIKTVRGKNLIVTEGGINHIARPALVSEAFPCTPVKTSSALKKPFSIHGPLCTALDHLGDFELPHDLSPGEWLEFKKVGAYGFTESMPYFLCHELAGEAYQYRNELHVPRVPESSEKWMV